MYALLTGIDFGVVLKIDLLHLTVVVSLLILLPIIGGIRLAIIAKVSGLVPSYKQGICARGASQFVALTTPATAGAQVIKAFWIKKLNGGWDLGFGVAYLEISFDVFLVNIVAMIASLVSLLNGDVRVIPVIFLSLYTMGSFSLLFIATGVKKLRKAILRIFEKLKIPLKETHLENFAKSLTNLVKNPKELIITILLTITYLITQGMVVLVIANAFGENMSLLGIIIFAAIIQVMGGIPIPGGAIGVEYGASLFLRPEIVVTWRVISYFGSLLFTFALFQVFMLRYVK